jgi:hypothetical protein
MILRFSGGEPFLVVEPEEFVEEVNRLVRNAAFVVCGDEAVPVLPRVSRKIKKVDHVSDSGMKDQRDETGQKWRTIYIGKPHLPAKKFVELLVQGDIVSLQVTL